MTDEGSIIPKNDGNEKAVDLLPFILKRRRPNDMILLMIND